MRDEIVTEDYSSFLRYIGTLCQLSSNAENAMKAVLVKRNMNRGDLLLKGGQVCKHLHFIEKGAARVYYLNEGREIVHWLGAENSIVTSIASFLSQNSSSQFIELIEDSSIISVKYNDLEDLYIRFHEIERLGRLLTQSALLQMQQRFDDLHFSSAAQRYQKLIKENPVFIRRFPLGVIASYLGITQETLSRIRHSSSF